VRLSHLLALAVAAGALAGAVHAQTITPLTIKDGTGDLQPLCQYKPDGTNLAGCTVQWVWNGSAWVLAPADSQGDLKTYDAGLGAGEDLTNNVQGVIAKPITGTTYSRLLDVSFGSAVTHNSKATAAQWFGAYVTNISASLAYLQLYNSTGSTSGTPVVSIPIPAGSATAPGVLEIDDRLLGQNGLNFATGLTWAISTTQSSYTAATAANFTATLTYQ